jgi:hypothetical protein
MSFFQIVLICGTDKAKLLTVTNFANFTTSMSILYYCWSLCGKQISNFEFTTETDKKYIEEQ